jgi:hypothetical protein
MFRHYHIIRSELEINTRQVTQVLQMQLLEIKVTIKVLHVGFMQIVML